MISVYEDQNAFRLKAEIHANDIKSAVDIVASEKSKCLYVTDSINNCIWKVTVDDHKVTRWLSDVEEPFTLSVTSDDHILKLCDGGHGCRLAMYGTDASTKGILTLSDCIQYPLHAVQKPSGQFIIMHKASAGNVGPVIISQLTNDGRITRQYHLPDIGQCENYPWHIYLDLEKDRLLLAGCSEHGVILFDSTSHKCENIRFIEEESGSYEGYISCECSKILHMHYDTRKKQFLIWHANRKGLSILEFSEI